jgi:hypothetical protein
MEEARLTPEQNTWLNMVANKFIDETLSRINSLDERVGKLRLEADEAMAEMCKAAHALEPFLPQIKGRFKDETSAAVLDDMVERHKKTLEKSEGSSDGKN